MLHAAHWKCRTQIFAIWAPSHNFVGLYLRNYDTYRQSEKKNLLNSNVSPHMSPEYGELRPTNGWDEFRSLGPPAHFYGLLVLAALLHGSLVLGISQTLWHWTEGATYIRQGSHHVGHWPTFLALLK